MLVSVAHVQSGGWVVTARPEIDPEHLVLGVARDGTVVLQEEDVVSPDEVEGDAILYWLSGDLRQSMGLRWQLGPKYTLRSPSGDMADVVVRRGENSGTGVCFESHTHSFFIGLPKECLMLPYEPHKPPTSPSKSRWEHMNDVFELGKES